MTPNEAASNPDDPEAVSEAVLLEFEFAASMRLFLVELRAFDLECKAEEYTDTGAFWELVEPRLKRWLPLEDAETCEHTEYDPELEICRACGEQVDHDHEENP